MLDVAYCYRLSGAICLSVSLLIMTVSRAKAAKQIGMSFGVCMLLGPKEPNSIGATDPPQKKHF